MERAVLGSIATRFLPLFSNAASAHCSLSQIIAINLGDKVFGRQRSGSVNVSGVYSSKNDVKTSIVNAVLIEE